MKLLFYSSHKFEEESFHQKFEEEGVAAEFTPLKLSQETAHLSSGYRAICIFVHDQVDSHLAKVLKECGVELILLRSAGFNNVDIRACAELGIKVCRVPDYSPFSVAEYAVALLQTLNRKIHRAIHRVREFNFSLDHLVGFDLHGKTVGILGTGKIGSQVCRILHGYGCKVLAYDIEENKNLLDKQICNYTDLESLLKKSDIISLHIPLNDKTKHIVNHSNIHLMKKGVILINTGRGALIDTQALVSAIKTGHIGGAALDVYEEEEDIFFVDHSFDVIQDDVMARLLAFPNVIMTAHQAFLTKEALQDIIQTTITSLKEFYECKKLTNEVSHIDR